MSWIAIPGHGGIPSPDASMPPQQWLDFAAVLSLAALAKGPNVEWDILRWIGETADAYLAKWYTPAWPLSYTRTIGGENLSP